MKKKIALIVLELVDESIGHKNEELIRDLWNWLTQDVIAIPWVRQVREVSVKKE